MVARILFKRGLPSRKIRAIFNFLENYVLFEDPEMNRIFREQIKPYDKNNVMSVDEFVKQTGIEKGIEIGRENSSRLFVENLLKESSFPVEKIASLANVTVDFVNKIKNELK